MPKPGLGAALPKLTREQIRTLKQLAADLNAVDKIRELRRRTYFERCGCPNDCYFHTTYGNA